MPTQTPIEPNDTTNNASQSKLAEVIAPLHRVTPTSKILAAVVMIILPFAGFWVGYNVGIFSDEGVIALQETLPELEPVTTSSEVTQAMDGYTDVDIPQIASKLNANDYTIAERSQYFKIPDNGRIGGFYTRRGDVIATQISTTTSAEEEIRMASDYKMIQLPIVRADASTFQINSLWNSYSRDKDHVYIYGRIIIDADPQTFLPVCGFTIGTNGFCSFSKDKNNFYWFTEKIKDADPATFVLVKVGFDYPSLAADTKTIYIAGDSIKTFTNGQSVHLANTRTLKVDDSSSTWAPHRGDFYSDGIYNYIEWFALSDSVNAYSLYEKSTKDSDRSDAKFFLSKVDKLGDKPKEIGPQKN